ncbi:MAG: hypothetical protein LUQ18_09590, partial [Methylococcaceae bacterium]|nr:hypothetical protein [Methylococcaceae bacterium]
MMTHNNIIKNLASPWWYLLVGDTLGLIALGFYWHYYSSLSIPQFVSAALLLWMTTALAAAPLIRFVLFDWEARYHEFLNRLNNESLIAYLQQFWEKRTTQNAAFIGWKSENPEKTHQINSSMEKIFDEIYHEQYGRIAFIAPMVLLNSVVFILTTLCVLVYSEQTILSLNIDSTVAIASIAGAYMYVVSDMVQCVRQRSLNASTIYWYVLRMLLAIPIGIALTYPLEPAVKPFVAFGLGTLPMDQIIKLLRRLTSKQLNLSEAAQESDQLIKLEGVTVRISSMLIAEGVDSIEQIIAVDPVLLSIRTGLPFKFILQLGSQAIVRRHLGETAEKLIPLGLADARSIAALVTDLDDTEKPNVQRKATAVLAAATSLITPTSVEATTTSNYSTECLEFNFRQIANENYAKFILG